MNTPTNLDLHGLTRGVALAITLSALVAGFGAVRSHAQSQTPYQQEQQKKQREEQQRQAEERRKENNQEQNRQPTQQRPAQESGAATEQSSGSASSTSNSTPRSVSPSTGTTPLQVYAPRASTATNPNDVGSHSSPVSQPAPGGTTVYKPHSLSATGTTRENSSSDQTSTPQAGGATVYTPHALAAAPATPSPAASTSTNGTTVYVPAAKSTQNTYSSAPASPSNNCVQVAGVSDKSLSWVCSNASGQIRSSAAPTLPNSSGTMALIQAFLNRLSANMAANSVPADPLAPSAPAGTCYWSSDWDGLEPEIQQRLRQPQTVDTVIADYGGPAQLIAYAQTPGNLAREFASLQGQSLGSSTDFQTMADGFVEVAQCRLGQSGTQQAVNATLADKHLVDCDSAQRYVSDPSGLQRDLDVAIAQRRAHQDGLVLQQNLKSELLSDSWWATSKGPVIAAQIQVVCNEVQDFVSIWNPEEAKLSQGKDMLMKSLQLSASMIKAAYDNRQSVTAAVQAAKDAEADQLGDFAAEEAADAIRMGPAYGTYKALQDSKNYVQTLNDAADARANVQDQLSKLDQQIAQAQAQVSIDAQKQMVLEALRQDVIAACVQTPVYIPKQ